MFEVISDVKYVNKMYTLHGYVGNPEERNDRYIQQSWYTGEPFIQTRLGYMAGNVICFVSKEEAYDFVEKFMTNPDRKNTHYINWKVIEYKPQGIKDKSITFKEINSKKYGRFYTIERIVCRRSF